MPVLENPRHEIFAREIAKGASQREAYANAGYEGDERSMDANAARLIADDRVAIRVQEIQAAAAKRAEITIERTLLELAKIGYADIRKAVRWGEGIAIKDAEGNEAIGNGVAMLDSAEIDNDTAAAIAEVAQTRDGIKIKFHDKLGALEKIGKHLGMFVDRHEHSGKDGGPIETVDLSPLEAARRIAFAWAKGERELDGK
ncbi:terminase small subunit [Methylocystis sp. H4A]|uniref:terminase small subunit n=1 Tax=Methylocystis sp. H4A TaxID=2785788 RepID=UPI0018C2DDC6|nr:terminase small subunit [Methylocystis sp. H4A]MBG0801652.1 terminase small subunit [Methylocystis sp. H4A]